MGEELNHVKKGFKQLVRNGMRQARFCSMAFLRRDRGLQSDPHLKVREVVLQQLDRSLDKAIRVEGLFSNSRLEMVRRLEQQNISS